MPHTKQHSKHHDWELYPVSNVISQSDSYKFASMSGIPMLMYPLNAVASEENMLNIVGPVQSTASVLEALSSCENKLHWAVNTYFRNKFINVTPIRRNLPTRGKSQHNNNNDIVSASVLANEHQVVTFKSTASSAKNHLNQIPLEVIEKIMSYLDFRSMNRWYTTTKRQRATAQAHRTSKSSRIRKSSIHLTEVDICENIWFMQLQYHCYIIPKIVPCSRGLMVGGRLPNTVIEEDSKSKVSGILASGEILRENYFSNSAVDSATKVVEPYLDGDKWHCIGEDTDSVNSYQMFRFYFESERLTVCLHCMEWTAVVPVVYGFPSQILVDQYRLKKLQMGGDYLMGGMAAFMCLHCGMQFFSYPYKCCYIITPDRIERNLEDRN